MTEHLATLAGLSLGGAVAILLLGLWSHASRTRYGARWRCWIWLVLSLRLLLPVSLLTPQKARPIQIDLPQNTVIYAPPAQETQQPPHENPAEKPAAPQTVPNRPDAAKPPVERPVAPSEETAPTNPAKPPFTLFQAITIVWALASVGMLSWALLTHARFLKFLHHWSRPVSDPETLALYGQVAHRMQVAHARRPQLRACKGLKAPMLAGVFHPVLLLPADYNAAGENLQYAMLHELIHYKRKDILLKTVVLCANCLHWFNPMMWYMTRLVERDTELACDEMALTYLSAEEYKIYGRTILDAVERMQAPRS